MYRTMFRQSWIGLIGFCICWSAVGAQDRSSAEAAAEPVLEQDSMDGFIRVRKDGKFKPLALETSITRFEGKSASGTPVVVDLIGVVHIGEQAYYETLNQRFAEYDVVLYELVAPEGTRIPKGGRIDEGLNPVAALQKGMQALLELEFQLDHIDYMQDKLLHADMTPDEFLESMSKNDESFAKMFFRAIGQSIAMQNSGGLNNADLLMTLMSKDPTVRVRRLMADQIRDVEAGMVIFQGRNGSTIIHHRNAKALRILRQQLEAGKTKVGVFYGAGHMPDMLTHLESDFQMQRGGRVWLEAWNLRDRD